jgi:hypothetical protein
MCDRLIGEKELRLGCIDDCGCVAWLTAGSNGVPKTDPTFV